MTKLLNSTKKFIPESFLAGLRAWVAKRNRRSILRNRRSGPLTLKPDACVEHYYHFLFDLCLPLFLLVNESQANFKLRLRGPFANITQELFGDRAKAIDPHTPSDSMDLVLRGMNPQLVSLSRQQIAAFRQFVLHRYAIGPSGPCRLVLLIERMPPDHFFKEEATKKGGGSSRRSIPNHTELANAISNATPKPFKFRNVRLEQLTFEEQVRAFSQAHLVIGQHGAGLANCLWLPKQSKVLELSHNLKLQHFKKICSAIGCDYTVHPTGGPHEPVHFESLKPALSKLRTCALA